MDREALGVWFPHDMEPDRMQSGRLEKEEVVSSWTLQPSGPFQTTMALGPAPSCLLSFVYAILSA